MMTSLQTAHVLDGKAVSNRIQAELTEELKTLKAQGGPLPKLVVMLVGDDPASHVYVSKKARVAQHIGMLSEVFAYPGDVDEATLLSEIDQLNRDTSVHAILVQLPLPRHLDSFKILMRIDARKDVDGLHPLSLGRLMMGQPTVKPCTPAGIMRLMREYQIPLEGKNAVVVGRSNIVGKPMGLLLLEENATVTTVHSRTQNRRDILRQADILVAAVGIPGFITAEDVKPGAVVIDVGINRVDGRLVGDVDFEPVRAKASYITPVPGGVGPMTIAMLMSNTVTLYRHSPG